MSGSATCLIVLTCLAIAPASCASVASQPRPATDLQGPAESDAKGTRSLFPSDAETLSDAEIARILDVRLELRSRIRLAVLHLDHRSVDFSYLYGGEAVPIGWLHADMFAMLRKLERVYDASYLPSVLIPAKLTVGHLREAGARYQADLLLIFRTECRTHHEFRIFRASQAKAYCLADAAVLDVRSGLVPFTSRATRDYLIEEQKSEIDFAETVRRSEQTAVEAAMLENASNLALFLKALPAGADDGRKPPQ